MNDVIVDGMFVMSSLTGAGYVGRKGRKRIYKVEKTLLKCF